jgi:hypothetical protein
MRVRTAAIFSILVALALIGLVTLWSNAFAQIGDPQPTGHGVCTQAPDTEPSESSGALCFDAFLMDRASRLVLAAMQWHPALTRSIALSPARPAVARMHASH